MSSKEALRAAREFLFGDATEHAGADSKDRAVRKPVGIGETAEGTSTASEGSDPGSECGPSSLELSAPDIRRTASGWRARCIHPRGVDSRHVNDARYGFYVGSFIEAVDVRDRFYRDRGIPIPWQIEAVVDGVHIAPEVVRRKRSIIVRWQGQEHVVTGKDAEEIATEIALDLFVELIDSLRPEAPGK